MNSKHPIFDKLFAFKKEIIESICKIILDGKVSNKFEPNYAIKINCGSICRIEVDSAGCYVLLHKDGERSSEPPQKIEMLSVESIIQIADYLGVGIDDE